VTPYVAALNFSAGSALVKLEKTLKKAIGKAMVLLILYLTILAGIFVYIIYGIIRFFKPY